MALNPDRNLYSVAPVGNAIVIGRVMALKGGLDRERVVNLIAWLTIATGAKPGEIAAEIAKAQTAVPQAKPVAIAEMPMVMSGPARLPEFKPKEGAAHLAIPSEIAGKVTPFIGRIDPEEKAAIDAAVQEVGERLRETEPIDADKLADFWAKVG